MNLQALEKKLYEKQKRAAGASMAVSAAVALVQMDPHSREDLICYIRSLDEAQAAGDDDACVYLVDAITEVFQNVEDGDAPDLDAWESQADQTPEGRKARANHIRGNERFLANYEHFKAKAGLRTIRDVAEATGLSPTTVQAIETQRVKPQSGTIQKLARGLGVTITQLLGDES